MSLSVCIPDAFNRRWQGHADGYSLLPQQRRYLNPSKMIDAREVEA